MFKKSVFVACALWWMTCGGLSVNAAADDKAAEVEKAIQRAETELEAVKEVGHVWQMIDPATGNSSVSISKLLTVAQEKQQAGELDEALRLASKVEAAAKLGQEQAASQTNPEPFYIK